MIILLTIILAWIVCLLFPFYIFLLSLLMYSFKGRRGRPCLTLLDTIRSGLKRRKISNSLRSISDFENLRVIALDRVKWKSFEKM